MRRIVVLLGLGVLVAASLTLVLPTPAPAQSPAAATETQRVSFGGIEFALHAPSKHCLLDTRQAMDEQLAAQFRPRAGKTNTYLGCIRGLQGARGHAGEASVLRLEFRLLSGCHVRSKQSGRATARPICAGSMQASSAPTMAHSTSQLPQKPPGVRSKPRCRRSRPGRGAPARAGRRPGRQWLLPALRLQTQGPHLRASRGVVDDSNVGQGPAADLYAHHALFQPRAPFARQIVPVRSGGARQIELLSPIGRFQLRRRHR